MAEIGLPEWFKGARSKPCPPGKRVKRARFVEKTGASAAKAFATLLRPGARVEETGRGGGLLGRVTPRGRILGALIIVLAGAIAGSLAFMLCLTGFVAVTAFLSSVRPSELAIRVLPAFVLTLVLVVPVLFISGGTELTGVELAGLKLSVTDKGLFTAIFFLTRVTTMVSAVMLLVLTTGESELFRGLRGLPIPALFVTALYMTKRFLLLLLKTAEDSAMARSSRTIDGALVKDSGGWFASRAALLLARSLKTSEEVTLAMVARGFTGRLKTFAPGRLGGGDFLWIGVASFIFFLAVGA